MEMIMEKLKSYGVGRRKLDDSLFVGEEPLRISIYDDYDNVSLEVIMSTCSIPGCVFTTDSILEFENHYNATHRYSCSQCKKVLPSPHFLDLHIQEAHDSFFAVMATRRPSYCCYIEECKEKFLNAEERLEHCVKNHKIPKDFRFDQKPKKTNSKKTKAKKFSKEKDVNAMDLDREPCKVENKFSFSNNKQKAFPKYTGKKFTIDNNKKASTSQDVNMDNIVDDLKISLPQ